MTAKNGRGRSKIASAAVEKGRPVGVKFTLRAKSNGRKIPDKDKRVIKLTIPVLIYKA